jgi:hypothetical protein
LVRFDRAIQANDEEALREAVGVYSGPFLEGCYEEWVLEERGAREAQCLSALEPWQIGPRNAAAERSFNTCAARRDWIHCENRWSGG